jgi:hypothetical protein
MGKIVVVSFGTAQDTWIGSRTNIYPDFGKFKIYIGELIGDYAGKLVEVEGIFGKDQFGDQFHIVEVSDARYIKEVEGGKINVSLEHVHVSDSNVRHQQLQYGDLKDFTLHDLYKYAIACQAWSDIVDAITKKDEHFKSFVFSSVVSNGVSHDFYINDNHCITIDCVYEYSKYKFRLNLNVFDTTLPLSITGSEPIRLTHLSFVGYLNLYKAIEGYL